MTTANWAYNYSYTDFGPIVNGYSNESREVETSANEAFSHYSSTETNESQLYRFIEQLYEISTTCYEDDWDGYGAYKITARVLGLTQEYIHYLEQYLSQMPELSPEPDGEVSLDWYGPNDSIFSISVGLGEKLSYSGIFPDGNSTHGTENNDQISIGKLVDKIKRVTEKQVRTETFANG